LPPSHTAAVGDHAVPEHNIIFKHGRMAVFYDIEPDLPSKCNEKMNTTS